MTSHSMYMHEINSATRKGMGRNTSVEEQQIIMKI